jgi:hypothetical protein
MSATETADATWVIPVHRVRESIQRLLDRDTHQFFIAYLHLRRVAGQLGTTTGLSPSWPDLGRILEVPGGPFPAKPYLRPFWKGTRGAGQEWLNSNLAGSFAPSSLRGVPMQVVETDAAGRFNLRDNHWQLAYERLLFGSKMPVVALSAFLFRDYGIVSSLPPDPDDLIALFRSEYGYRAEDEEEFLTLYDTDWDGPRSGWAEHLASESL